MSEFIQAQATQIIRLCVWLAILTLVFVPLERIFALHPGKLMRRDTLTDVAFYLLNSLAPSLLLIAPVALLAWGLHGLMPEIYLATVAGWPLWLRLSLVLAVGEVGAYWGHRWSHEVPWLWRFHAVHHNPEHIHFLTNTRAHPLDMVFTRSPAWPLSEPR